MKKRKHFSCLGRIKKMLLIMKITAFILLVSIMQVSASVYSQTARFTLNLKEASITEVLEIIQSQSKFEFFYTHEEVNKGQKINLQIEEGTVMEVLDQCLENAALGYEIIDDVIIITPAGETNESVLGDEQFAILIKGKVTDSQGNPLPGTTIMEKGTLNGVTTDAEGNYSIKIKDPNATLVVSFIGFETQTISLKGKTSMNIVLNESVTDLGEVVVTGYQTLPKERVTGSYSTVGAEELKKAGSNFSLKNRLEDLIPGLYFEAHYDDETDPSDEDSKSIIIRGVNTFGNNNPLIVIDGFPIDPDISDPWTTMNPDDVESITVLKDAAAASIWGAQAANGVIVIETKKGDAKLSKPVYNISLDYMSMPKPDLSKIPWASSEEAVDIYKWMVLEHDWFDRLITTYYDRYELPEVMRVLVDMKAGNITETSGNERLEELSQLDVRDEFSKLFLRPETRKRVNLSIQTGGEFHRTRTSITTIANNEYTKGNSDYQFLANINDEYSPAKWLKFSLGMNLSLSKKEKNGVVINDLNYIPQHSRILDDNGDYIPMIMQGYSYEYYDFGTNQRRDTVAKYKLPYNWDWNLKQDVDNRDNTEKNTDLRVNAKVVFTPVKPLSLELSYQYSRSHTLTHSYYNEESWMVRNLVNYNAQPDGSFPIPRGGMLTEVRKSSYSHDVRFQFIFNKKFGFHEIKALGGMERRQSYYESTPYAYYGYDIQSLTYNTSINFADHFDKINGDYVFDGRLPAFPGTNYPPRLIGSDNRFVSYYGNMGYTFKNKYDFTASIRQDKTNLYGQTADYRDLPQWSVGLGWALGKEKFFKGIKFVNHLRLRASYGSNGNIDKSASPYISGTRFVDPVTQIPYTSVKYAPNPSLTWEKTNVINIGLDFALFQDKLKGSLEYYSKYTTNVLLATAVNGTYGFQFNQITTNVGNLKNTGIELKLKATVINNKDFKWQSTLNFGTNRNRAVGFNPTSSSFLAYMIAGYRNPLVGQPASYMAAMRWAGYDENGMPQFYYGKNTIYSVIDAPDDYTLDPDSVLTFVGQRNPKVYGSFINSFSYKNFELSIHLSYKFGHKIWDDYPAYGMANSYLTYRKYFTFLPNLMVNRWQSPEDAETASMYSLNEVNTSTNVNNLLSYLEHYNDKKALPADQIRLQSINLAYRLPASKLKGVVKSVVIHVEARNLGPIWVANKKGIDPSNPPYSSSTYGALMYVTRYRPEYSIGLRLGF